MMSDDPVTLQELGNQLGVSKERVRQLEERARTKLRLRLAGFRANEAHIHEAPELAELAEAV
ncbi:MAG: hypothetical protein JWM74_1574, partial [Myxococcaceae bacterium]|nr:hypothetical protein [Myxococcaceae bacterium]